MLNVGAWVKRAFRGRGRFDPSIGMRRIPAATVRQFTKRDLDACRKLYELNEPGRFPVGFLQTFTESLESPQYLYLVAESEGEIAAVGGIYRMPELASGSSLAFGMVDPNLHRQGFGTTLLLARIAALKKPAGVWWVHLSSAGGSSTFFERFGFQFYGRQALSDSRAFDCYRCHVQVSDWSSCARILQKRNVNFDLEGIEVPIGPVASDNSPQVTSDR